MTTPRLKLLLCLCLTAASAHAADRDHAAEPPLLVTAAGEGSTVPVNPVTTSPRPAESVGTVANLPDLPQARPIALSLPQPIAGAALPARPSRISFGRPQSRGVSPFASMPLAGAVRRLGAQRFNTDDGSRLDDFAICYRMSGRSSIEVIPGDPAPVKLPVVSIANNTGVTVGMVYRLSR